MSKIPCNLKPFCSLTKLKLMLYLLVFKICLQNVTIVAITDPVWRAIFALNLVVQKRDFLILAILVWDCGIIWMKTSVLQEVLTCLRKKLKTYLYWFLFWLMCFVVTELSVLFFWNEKGLSHLQHANLYRANICLSMSLSI